MGCISGLSRVFVIAINIKFLIIGVLFFGGGLFLRFGGAIIKNALTVVETALESSISAATGNDVDINLDIGKLLLSFALAFIFSGLFLVAITMFGCCGACYKIKCLLVIYIVLCSVFLIGEVVTVGLVYGKPETITNPTKNALKQSIQSDYEGLEGTNIVSMGWNIAMQKLKCCGVDSYNDFTGATNWKSSVDTTSEGGRVYTLMTPISCCKTLPDDSDLSCAETPTSSNNYLNDGCFDKVWNLFRSYMHSSYVIVALSLIGVLQLLLILAAIILLCSEMKSKKSKVHPSDSESNKKPQRRH